MSVRAVLLPLGLLWLIGNGLRLPILAVPPVIPALRTELGLSGTEIGILTGLPIVLFAAAALPGSLLIAKTGPARTMILGLLLVAAGSATRAAAPGALPLFAATALMGAGVAIAQPSIPVLVRAWLPERIGLGVAIYTNGLLVGEILPVALFGLLIGLVGGWRETFVLWGVVVALIALAAMVAVRRGPQVRPTSSAPARWWPDWRDPQIWRLGFIFASANTTYFASNAFLPGQLTEAGRPELIGPALTALNLGQLPASFLLIAFARRLERKAWPFVIAGFLEIASLLGIVGTADDWTVAAAGLLGFSAGGAFALGLTLPPLLSAPADVARLSAAMFTISYSICVLISVASGAAWDLAGSAVWAFLPIGLAALPTILLAPSLRFDRRAT